MLDDIRARDAGTELIGDSLDPPEGVVFTDSCIMRAYDRRYLLAALDKAEDDAKALAEALNDASIDAHAYGPVREHWAGPDGKLEDGPVPFDQCQDRFCEAARTALAAHKEATDE
jgi:hypothetical protein